MAASPHRPPSPAMVGAVLSLVGASGYFVGEGLGVWLTVDGVPAWSPLITLGAGAPVALCLGVAGALAWHGWARSLHVDRATPPSSALLRWALRDAPDRLLERTARVITVTLLSVCWAGAAAVATVVLTPLIVTPLLGAFASSGAGLVLALACFALAGPVHLASRAALRLLARDARARWLTTPAGLGAAVALALAAGTGTAFALWPETAAVLPWSFAVGALGAIVTAAAALAWFVAGTGLARVALAAAALTLGAFAALTLWLPSSLQAGRGALVGPPSIAGFWVTTVGRLTDFDADGASGFYGGGDCAPRNPAVHPRALETPNNGVDEDCRMGDLTADVGRYTMGRNHHLRPMGIADRPNILLITIDALSHGHTGFGGYGRPVTANLDAFAKRATVFESAFSVSSSTRLTFPALVTGQFDSMVSLVPGRRNPHDYDPKTRSLAVALRELGYVTHHIFGDDYFDRGRWGGYWMGFDTVDAETYRRARDPQHTAPEVTDAALRVLEEHRPAPLFLWVHYYDVHERYVQPTGAPVFGTDAVDRYDAELAFLDQHVGRLLAAAEARWPEAERVIAVASDHGEAFDAAHKRLHHDFTLDTPVLHIPLVIQGPWAEGRGRRVKGLVSQLDLVPTLVNLAGASSAGALIGESLVPAVVSGREPEKSVVFSLFHIPEDRIRADDPYRMLSVRTDTHAYTIDYRKNAARLVRWREDPLDEDDVSAEEPETTALLNYLAAERLRWLRQHEGGFVTKAKKKRKKKRAAPTPIPGAP